MLFSSTSSRRAGSLAVLGAVLAVGAGGCGDDDDSGSQPAGTNAAASGPALRSEPSPSKLTCADLANRENYVVTYETALTLAERERMPGGNTQQAAVRITGAMVDLCEKRGEPAYAPAADAVAAVKRGEYANRTQLP
jgi:hypothetical protein